MNACLTPDQRERFLDEYPSDAWHAHAACESQFGRIAEAVEFETRPPPGSESGWVSDFEGGQPVAKFGAGWHPFMDSMMGGKSTSEHRVVQGGAGGSKGSLLITGHIESAQERSFAGVHFFPGVKAGQPANLSLKETLSFRAKGDRKTYWIALFTQSRGDDPVVKTFGTGPEWKRYTFPLVEFEGIDGSELTAVFFGQGLDEGAFSLQIDDVRFESDRPMRPASVATDENPR